MFQIFSNLNFQEMLYINLEKNVTSCSLVEKKANKLHHKYTELCRFGQYLKQMSADIPYVESVLSLHP